MKLIWLILISLAVAVGAEDGPLAVDQAKEAADEDPDISDLLGNELSQEQGLDEPKKDSNVTTAPGQVQPEEPKDALPVNPELLNPKDDDEPDLMGDDEEEKEKEKAAEEAAKSNETETDEQVFLPEKGEAEKEHSSSLAIFFVLSVLMLCIFLVHFTLQLKCHYIPESVAIIFFGALIALFMKLLPMEDFKKVESFSPTMFFLVLLPPIIFESGYNLHKGNFFTNIGSIMLFAIIGTTISALIVGGGIFLLGLADVVYKLDFIQSFAFGSLISAVDPVATLAIFQALDVDPVLNMLVSDLFNDLLARKMH